MIFIHHVAWFIMASLGIILGYLFSKVSFMRWRPLLLMFLFFSIGVFFHIFLVDAITYTYIFENGESVFDKYMVQCRRWYQLNLKRTVEIMVDKGWNFPYIEEYYRNITEMW